MKHTLLYVFLWISTSHCSASYPLAEIAQVFDACICDGALRFEEILDPHLIRPVEPTGKTKFQVVVTDAKKRDRKPKMFEESAFTDRLRAIAQQMGSATPIFIRINRSISIEQLAPILKTARDFGFRNFFLLLDPDAGTPLYDCLRLSLDAEDLESRCGPPTPNKAMEGTAR